MVVHLPTKWSDFERSQWADGTLEKKENPLLTSVKPEGPQQQQWKAKLWFTEFTS